MYKQISIIFVCLLALSACGIKGPLYQTPSEEVEPNMPKVNKNSSISTKQEN